MHLTRFFIYFQIRRIKRRVQDTCDAISSGELPYFPLILRYAASSFTPAQQTRSGTSFSPWEVSKSIASSIKDFAFDTLLMRAIVAEKEHDGEGTEHDPSDGTGFRAVQDPMISSSTPPSAASNGLASSTRIPTEPPTLRNAPRTDTACNLDDS